MRKFITKAYLLYTIFTFSFFFCCGKEYLLQYKLSKGNIFRERMITDMLIKQTIMGSETNISSIITTDMTYTVTDVQNDLYTIQLKFDEIRMDIDLGIKKISYNSNTAEDFATENDLSPLFKTMTSKYFTMNMNQFGEIHSFSGFDDFTESIFNSIDTDIDENTKSQMIAQIEEQFSDEALKSMFQQNMTAYYPKKPVQKGEEWTSNISVKNGQFDIVSNLQMKLKKVVKNTAVIEFNGNISTPGESTIQEAEGIVFKTTISGSQTGSAVIDMNTGFFISGEIKLNLAGKVEYMDIEIPMIIITKTTITEIK